MTCMKPFLLHISVSLPNTISVGLDSPPPMTSRSGGWSDRHHNHHSFEYDPALPRCPTSAICGGENHFRPFRIQSAISSGLCSPPIHGPSSWYPHAASKSVNLLTSPPTSPDHFPMSLCFHTGCCDTCGSGVRSGLRNRGSHGLSGGGVRAGDVVVPEGASWGGSVGACHSISTPDAATPAALESALVCAIAALMGSRAAVSGLVTWSHLKALPGVAALGLVTVSCQKARLNGLPGAHPPTTPPEKWMLLQQQTPLPLLR
ncbi:hypothetical protein B0H17DRAFT_1207527 [Mycena rosella]|uniref:Uncharacterized protein n=1 Tax=Mycena rosella TaxID=1033263 RepID=A0AAD7G7U8_MYCRO|nr:hypothetical protein B0H17DRAFT_1207527 [Mycena rosella]